MSAACLEAHQALSQQLIKAVPAQLQLTQQRVSNTLWMRGDGFQGVPLTWCPAQARVVRSGPGCGMPEALLAGFGRLALAQQHRQGPAEGVAKAVLIILGGPEAQLEQGRWQWGHAVRQVQREPELRFGDWRVRDAEAGDRRER